jgi:hypothetical protein
MEMDFDLDLDELEPMYGGGETADTEECAHDNVRVERFDAGRCTETGYRDAGERIICRDCGFQGVA